MRVYKSKGDKFMEKQRFQTGRKQYSLSGQGIDAISDSVQQCLLALKYESKNALRIRLSIEEILLIWRDRFGEDAACTLTTGYRFRKPYILLETEGEACDPLEDAEASLGEWGLNLLSRIGLSPSYSYAKGKNACRFELKAPSMNPVHKLLATIILAIVCGLLGLLLPEGVRTSLATEGLTRLSDSFYGLLSMISGPLVFLSVLMGICGIGDTATLGGIGKKLILGFAGLSCAGTAFACGAYALVFHLRPAAGAAASSGLLDMADMVLGMIPDNILNPFLLNSSLQIIVLAAMVGIAMLSLGKRVERLYNAVEQFQQLIQVIMNWIGALIPFLIFIVVLQNIWEGSLSTLIGAWKPFVFVLGVLALLLVGMLFYTAFRLRMKPLDLARKLLPSFMIALTTASSSASLGEIFSCCERKLGIEKRLSNFGVPLGVVMCVAGSGVGFISCVLYSAQSYQTPVSLAGMLIAVFSATLLIIASPPVAGGVLSCYALIFSQLGIPADGLGVIVTLNIFMDFFCTAVNVVMIEMMLALKTRKAPPLREKT